MADGSEKETELVRQPAFQARWFRLRDTHGVEVAPGLDEIVVLAVAVAVNAMADRAG